MGSSKTGKITWSERGGIIAEQASLSSWNSTRLAKPYKTKIFDLRTKIYMPQRNLRVTQLEGNVTNCHASKEINWGAINPKNTVYIGLKVLYKKKLSSLIQTSPGVGKFAWLSSRNRKLGTKVKSPTSNEWRMSGLSWLNVSELASRRSFFATAPALSFATVKHLRIYKRTQCSHGDQRGCGKFKCKFKYSI